MKWVQLFKISIKLFFIVFKIVTFITAKPYFKQMKLPEILTQLIILVCARARDCVTCKN